MFHANCLLLRCHDLPCPRCSWMVSFAIRPKKKFVMLPSPDQNLKIGSVGRDFFFFFFFLTYRERVEFSNIFFKVSKWGKLGRNAVKTHIYTSHASDFLSHWIQILANSSPKSDIKKKQNKKKTRPCFFAFYGRSGEGNITFFFFWPKQYPRMDHGAP